MAPRIRRFTGALVVVAALTAEAQGVSTASIGGTVRDASGGQRSKGTRQRAKRRRRS